MYRKALNFILELIEDNKGSPLVEEGILIGLAVLSLTVLIGIILSVLGWTSNSITNIFNYLNRVANGFFVLP